MFYLELLNIEILHINKYFLLFGCDQINFARFLFTNDSEKFIMSTTFSRKLGFTCGGVRFWQNFYQVFSLILNSSCDELNKFRDQRIVQEKNVDHLTV